MTTPSNALKGPTVFAFSKSGLFWLLFALLQASTLWAQAEDSEASESSTTLAALNANIEQLDSDKELDDDTRQLLLELYRKSVSNLQAEEADRLAAEKFRRSIESAPSETAKLEQELAEARDEPFNPYPQFNDQTDSADLAQALLEERANLAAVNADVSRLKLNLKVDQERLEEARRELARANLQRDKQAVGALSKPAPTDSAEVRKAREQYRETLLLALGAKIKRLDQELLSHGPRIQLLKMQIARREMALEDLAATVEILEEKLGKRRRDDAMEAVVTAKAAQLEAQGKHPLLVEVARENAAVSQRLAVQSREIEKVNKATSDKEAEAKELEESYSLVRQKLEIAGMNKALGRILQEQRTGLPSRREIRGSLADEGRLIADLALQQIILEENLDALKDIDAYIEQRLSELEPEESLDRDSLREELKDLLKQRVKLYSEAGAVSSAYLQSLSDLEYAEQRLLDNVEQYDAFLGERLLWVRSAPSPGIDRLFSISRERMANFSLSAWREAVAQLFKVDRFWLPQFAGLLLALFIYWRRADIRERLLATGKHVGNPVHDRIGYSLKALLWTVLLATPQALALASVGMKLKFATDPNALSQALGVACLWVAESGFFIAVLRELCRPDGLAQRHFLWPQELLSPLRRESLKLIRLFLPVGFVSVVLASIGAFGMEWGFMQVAMVLAIWLFAAFFLRLLSNRGEFIAALQVSNPRSVLVRWRRLWLAIGVIIPLVLTGLILFGYVYTASVLMASYVDSFWVVIAVIIVYQLGLRLLHVIAARLNYKALQEERKRQLQELIDAGESTTEAEIKTPQTEVNIEDLGRGTLKVVNIVATFLAVVGLLLVWSNVLPALNYLDNIVLWTYSGVEDGSAAVLQVSLLDLGFALLVVAITYFIYSSLSPVLELLFLHVGSMDASDRYTAVKLLRYVVLTVGFLLVTGMLGMSWSQFQWLAAALGVGIGFGLQEIVANFISGLIILFERPIRVGDRVTVGDVDGIVTRIQIRATTILTWDRQELLVPNKEFITGRLLNWSLSDQVSRLVIPVGVAYGSDVDRAMRLMERVAQDHAKILDDPAPFVTFDNFGDSTLNLILRCFLDDMSARLTTASELTLAINSAFNAAGIEIAFPQRDINFADDQVLHVNLQGQSTPPQPGGAP